jgi:ion channel-forming bestrophin family protein
VIDYDAKNWPRVLVTLHGSIAPRLMVRTALIAAVGALAAYLHITRGVKLDARPHTLIGAALGLLLVFRTNASYDRWWEGRKLLGSMVNRCRDYARQIHGYASGASNYSDIATTVTRHLSLYYALAVQGLRSEDDLKVLGDLVTADEAKKLTGKKARASLVLAWLTSALAGLAADGTISEARLQVMDANLTALIDGHSACERIARTPVPFAYAQHIKLFVTLFCVTVPFALADTMRWFTPVASAIFAYALFGIDEIGVEIEDPFGHDLSDLPMDRIATTIATSVREVTDDARK